MIVAGRVPRILSVWASAVTVLASAPSLAAAPLGYYPAGEPRWTAPGTDSPPIWSADGREVLFQRTRDEGIAQIWAVAPDGSGLRRVSDGSFSAGHPDACGEGEDDRLALVSDRDGPREVYVMRRDGKGLRRLTTSGPDKAWPVFSPDCREIVFVEMRDRQAGRYDLRIVDVASGEVRTLLEAVRYLGWPTWSSDGRWVLFHRELAGYPNHLWRVRPDGSAAEPLSAGDHGDYWSAHMSRDGRLFSFNYGARQQLQWGANADLWVMDRESRRCSRIRGEPWHEHGHRLSPDGRRMVYWDNRDGYNEVFVLDLATGSSRQLTFQPPGELTGIARRQGESAALAHAGSRPGGAARYSEGAMAALLARWAREARPPAVRLAELFLRDYPQSRRARAALARERFRAAHLRQAREDYRRRLAASPSDADAVSRLGVLAVLEHLTGRALAELEREKLPEREVNSLGYALLRDGNLEEAIDVFGWIVLRNPTSANAYDSLGEALYWRGEHGAARAAYEASLRYAPDNDDSSRDNARRFLRRIASAEAGIDPIPCPEWPTAGP